MAKREDEKIYSKVPLKCSRYFSKNSPLNHKKVSTYTFFEKNTLKSLYLKNMAKLEQISLNSLYL
jgi:hypothetical protein